MLQFTYLPNGDLKITTDTSDILLKELFNQFSQGMATVPNTFVSKSIYTATMYITVRNEADVPKLLNPSYQLYQISTLSKKIISRSSTDFFVGLLDLFKQGYVYQEGSANLVFGAYSAVVSTVQRDTGLTDGEEKIYEVDSFDMSIAMSYEDKDALVEYCEKYGVNVDKRKSLSKIKNWLKSQAVQGE